MAESPTAHVVVVGGGFGGLALVRELTTRRRPASLRVTLVDRRNHHTFQPLLYQVATAVLQPQDIGVSFRAILRRRVRWDVRLGEVTGVDPDSRIRKLADGATIAYDKLVLAAGAITEDFGIPGVAEHAFGLKPLADAVRGRVAAVGVALVPRHRPRRWQASDYGSSTSGRRRRPRRREGPSGAAGPTSHRWAD